MTQQEYYNRLYKKAKKVIGNHTPLKADCGQLCDGACCKGDENTGMLLFPFEETGLDIKTTEEYRLAVCNGSCDREERPLSCMIFPFFPCIDENGEITAKPDLRGLSVCPMLHHIDEIRFDRVFLRRVARVGRILSKDEACRQMLEEISREIEDYEKMQKRFSMHN